MTGIILIVDDNEQVALSLVSILEDIPKISTVVASNGHDALQIARDPARHIRLLITDFDLPLLDGHSLIRVFRSLPNYRDVPVLMITGDRIAAAMGADRMDGPNHTLTKPFSSREVRRVVEAILTDTSTASSAIDRFEQRADSS